MFGFILLELQYIKRKKVSGEMLLTDLGCDDSRDMSRTVPKLLPGTSTSNLDTLFCFAFLSLNLEKRRSRGQNA